MNESIPLQSLTRYKTASVVATPDQNHSSPDRGNINHFTHTNGTTTTAPNFDILSPIITPKASDRKTWSNISETFTSLHAVSPIYRNNDLPGEKLNKLNSFTYSFFETEYGCRKPKPKVTRRRERDPEKKKLRSLKRELRREFKKNKSSGCVDDLKKRFFKVTKLLNIMRKQNADVKGAADFQKQTRSFRENPQKFAKKFFENGEFQEPNFDAGKAQDFFSETYSDNIRGMTYQHPPNISRPGKPHCPFKTNPPTMEEIITSLSRKRNAAAPGPNGIPYLVYKKIPFLRYHLSLILQEMWPNFELPYSRYGVTGLIYKSGPSDEVSNYRPVTMTNTDGKILLSILASRSLSYMKVNGYYDLGIQKGFINDMAGCAEHTTMLSELLKNAKQSNRQITVCWTDLENAFGSLRHDLIQFALEWYHFPVEIREFVYDYYEGLYIKVRTNKWITEPIALLMGIFQGCPLSVQLFNIVWNIGLETVKSSPAGGYKLKEAGIEKQQLSYVDDETVIAISPEDAQLALDSLDSYLTWTECVRAKPRKCRALAFKVFKKGVDDKFTPVSDRRYSAYDPMLSISGQSIPFLGDEPFKFLGRKLSTKKESHNRAEIREHFINNLELVDKANITGPMKMWLYNNYIVAFITWPFMVYDLPISFGEELKAIATRNLKRWLGITKTTTESALYRSKDHFGLGLTDIVTHLRKMQVCRMHMLKYSQDESCRSLYKYMKERDKPPLNKLGIPMKPKVWKPTNALEKAERNIYLDNIAFGQQHHHLQVNKSSAKWERHNTLKRVERDDEEARLTRCYGYAIQGDWLNFDAVLKADLSWSSLIYSIPRELLKFLLNSTHNVLPTSDNLRRWGKTVVDLRCCLCGFSNPTLKHILNGCSMALKQGRYTWRHDSILLHLSEVLHSFLQTVNSCSVPVADIKDTFITFVREGEQPSKGRAAPTSGLLLTANDWILAYDSVQSPLVIPCHIAQSSFRPDIIIYSNNTKQIFMLELTVPAEDNIIQRHTDKENKYAKLLDDININQWTGKIYAIEVGSRGYVAKSFIYALKTLGVKQNIVGNLKKAVSLICLRCSYSIYLSRNNEIWRPWEAQQFLRKKGSGSPPAEGNLLAAGDSVSEAFGGFSTAQVLEGAKVNRRKLKILHRGVRDSVVFEGFDATETGAYRKVNSVRTDLLKSYRRGLAAAHEETPLRCGRVLPGTPGPVLIKATKSSAVENKGTQNAAKRQFYNKAARISSTNCQSYTKSSGLVNLGNSCYMNSVMQCLKSVFLFVKYFTKDTYVEDINRTSSYDGSVAREVGSAFGAMAAGGKRPVSLKTLKAKVGELHHDFSGCTQNDSHEFLVHLFTWLHEDLRGGGLQFARSFDLMLHPAEAVTSELSVISFLFQGLHRLAISCQNCHWESVRVEPFTVLSLSLPASGNCRLESLINSYHEDTYIEGYNCPSCSVRGRGTSKTSIQKLPPILIIHLSRFEFNVSARKKHNYVNFPLENFTLGDHVLKGENSALYNLCAVSNHIGTINGGHYTSYCKSSYDDSWYHCNDQTVTKLRTPIETSNAYLLFYDSTGLSK